MKITILTPDFSHNCFGRAWLLAKLLQKEYDIEMIGPAFGNGIWKPLKDECDFPIKMVKSYANGRFEFRKMLNNISGDIIYASKPLFASFGVGLVKKIKTRKPLVLDIDDWELGFGKEFYDSLIWYKKINDFRLSISNLRSYYYAVILNKFIRFANDVTVSGNILKSIYGGTIVWHGRDSEKFNPFEYNKSKFKKKYLGNLHRKANVIGFLGTPNPHKGLEDLIDAMSILDEKYLLILVGFNESSYCKALKRRIMRSSLKERIIIFGEQHFSILPEILALTDLVVIPQRRKPASYGQIPAKIFDAMAMAKPIVSTNIPGIKEILKDCGWIVEPEKIDNLAIAIKYVFEHPDEATEIGWKAYEKFKKEYSYQAVEGSLMKIFEKYRTKMESV